MERVQSGEYSLMSVNAFDPEQNTAVQNQLHSKKNKTIKKSRADTVHAKVCYVCKKLCANNYRLKLHIKKHNLKLKFSCNYCEKSYKYKKPLQNHVILNHGHEMYFSCILCDKEFESLIEIKQHYIFIHENNIPFDLEKNSNYINIHRDYNMYKISNSVNTTKSNSSELHLQKNTTPESNVKNGTEKKLSCKFCGETFIFSRGLKKHLLSHNTLETYQCDLGRTGMKNSGLNSDAPKDTSSTNNAEPISEEACMASESGTYMQTEIPDQSYPDIHEEQYELENQEQIEEYPYMCNYCNIIFSSTENLQLHLKIHPENVKFKCNICLNIFENVYLLDEHVKEHLKLNICNVCDQSFSTVDQLCTHLHTHIVENGFICEICKIRFETEIEVKLHQKSHDIISNDQITAKEDLQSSYINNEVISNDMSDAIFLANIISQIKNKQLHSNKNQENLNLTLENKSSFNMAEDTQFPCDLCPSVFNSSDLLKIHTTYHDNFNISQCKDTEINEHTEKNILNIHTINPNNKEEISVIIFKCTKCNMVFTDKIDLELHSFTHIADTDDYFNNKNDSYKLKESPPALELNTTDINNINKKCMPEQIFPVKKVQREKRCSKKVVKKLRLTKNKFWKKRVTKLLHRARNPIKGSRRLVVPVRHLVPADIPPVRHTRSMTVARASEGDGAQLEMRSRPPSPETTTVEEPNHQRWSPVISREEIIKVKPCSVLLDRREVLRSSNGNRTAITEVKSCHVLLNRGEILTSPVQHAEITKVKSCQAVMDEREITITDKRQSDITKVKLCHVVVHRREISMSSKPSQTEEITKAKPHNFPMDRGTMSTNQDGISESEPSNVLFHRGVGPPYIFPSSRSTATPPRKARRRPTSNNFVLKNKQ